MISPAESAAPSALITGGGGDIGRAIARRHLAVGSRVVLIDASSEALERAERELHADPHHLLAIQADVSSEADVIRFTEQAARFLGGIPAFFNNAGIEGTAEPITRLALEDFERVMAVNVSGVFLGLKHVLPLMVEQRHGAVVNSASVSGLRGAETLSAYVASKHAVVGLTRTAALEVAGDGVRVNAICPSGVEGRMIRSLEEMAIRHSNGENNESFAARNPTRRLASAEEIASVATFLASDAASFVNGAAWVIDGGRTVR
jgi:NAD(P)-dependent dehydrogenase (short-subunit alcohol dehydrogenase family)